MRALLSGKNNDEKRLLQRILFAARESCPLCDAVERRAASALHELCRQIDARAARKKNRGGVRLCLPHFRQFAAECDSTKLVELAQAQLDSLRRMARYLESISGSGHGLVRTDIEPLRIEAILRWAGGDGTRLFGFAEAVEERLRRAACEHSDLARALACSYACALCIERWRAAQRWYEAVMRVGHIGKDLWTVLPACSRHLHEIASQADTVLRVVLLRHFLALNTVRLERGLEAVAQWDRRLEAEAHSVWFRRRSPAYILGRRRKAVLAMPRCPGCDRIAVAEERAMDEFFSLLRMSKARENFTRGYGLCPKHFAESWLRAPGEGMRALLVRSQTIALDALCDELQNARRADAAAAPSGTEPWRYAAVRLSGACARPSRRSSVLN